MYTNKHNLLYGADPEVFASRGENYAISPAFVDDDFGLHAIDTSVEKHPVYLETDVHKIVGDGVAYEFNFKMPFDHPRKLWQACRDAEEHLGTELSRLGLSLFKAPVVNFDFARFWTEHYMKIDKYYWSMVAGCDPDKDAFNPGWEPEPLDFSKHPNRYGGGHLHFSGHPMFAEFPIPYVKLLAILLGNSCVLNSDYPTLEVIRASYFGMPGKYREQVYSDGTAGVEYRTPSNAWLSYDYPKFERMFELVNRATDLFNDPREGERVINMYSEPTIQAITNADKGLSRQVLELMNEA